MKFQSIASTPKTAAAKSAPQPATQPVSEKTAMDAMVTQTIQSVRSVKTASAATPAQPEPSEVAKLAAETLAADKTAQLMHHSLAGQAMAHGFMQTLTQYGSAADGLATKTASEMGVTAEDLQLLKVAKEDPERFLAWVYEGAQVKQASDQQTYDATAQATLEGIHKLASDHFVAGYLAADEALKA
jgi:hypothetical protein